MDPLPLWSFWFEDGPKDRWFRKDPQFDEALRTRFGHLPDAALRGDLAPWAADPLGVVSLVLVLDQLPRNLYRGDARMFAYDVAARAGATQAIDAGLDLTRSVDERCFLYLPFEHSESVDDQARAIALFTALGDAPYLRYAEAHRDIIVRFGRFPHRNAALGRESTPEEQAFLSQPGSSF